jgi:hypothetical protein
MMYSGHDSTIMPLLTGMLAPRTYCICWIVLQTVWDACRSMTCEACGSIHVTVRVLWYCLAF